MLVKYQKFMMYLIGVLSMIVGILVIIPYRAFWPNADIFSLELVFKLLVLPLVFILLALYPNVLKYRQVARYREHSKVVSVMSYFPYVSYLTGLLGYGFYILGKGVEPFLNRGLGLGAFSLWVTILIVSLVLLIILIHFFTRFEMLLNVKQHIILDGCLGITVAFFAIFILKISQIYRIFFINNVPKPTGETGLFILLLISFIVFIFHLRFLAHFIHRNEVNIVVRANNLNDLKQIEKKEYKSAYKEAFRKFKKQLKERGLHQGAGHAEEEFESFKIITRKPEITKEEKDEVVEVVVLPVDKKEIQKVEAEREKLEAEKVEMEKLDKVVREKSKEVELKRQAFIKKMEEDLPKEVIEEESGILPSKGIQPSFKVITDFAKSIPGCTTSENEENNTIRFLINNKVFLIANETNNDYRLTFLYDLNQIVQLMIKYPTVVKAKTPKGSNWFKLVNKGEFKADDLYDIIEMSYQTFMNLESQKDGSEVNNVE